MSIRTGTGRDGETRRSREARAGRKSRPGGRSGARSKKRAGGRRARGADAGRPSSARKGAGANRRVDRLRAWFPALRCKGGYGLAAMAGVVEGTGHGWDGTVVVMDWLRAGKSRTGPEAAIGRAAKAVASAIRVAHLAAVLGALGSPHRLRILLKLLEGPATYRAIKKVTSLKPGPLYHHIGQLRLAGLIGPKERDLYQLTRRGRDVFLVVVQADVLSRRRPGRKAKSKVR